MLKRARPDSPDIFKLKDALIKTLLQKEARFSKSDAADDVLKGSVLERHPTRLIPQLSFWRLLATLIFIRLLLQRVCVVRVRALMTAAAAACVQSGDAVASLDVR